MNSAHHRLRAHSMGRDETASPAKGGSASCQSPLPVTTASHRRHHMYPESFLQRFNDFASHPALVISLCLCMTWTSRSFFSDGVLSGRTRRLEDKKSELFGIGRSCYVLCQAGLLRSAASHILFPGRKEQCSWKATIQWGEVIRKRTKQCCTKRSQDISRCQK